jgi:hypothetical protein
MLPVIQISFGISRILANRAQTHRWTTRFLRRLAQLKVRMGFLASHPALFIMLNCVAYKNAPERSRSCVRTAFSLMPPGSRAIKSARHLHCVICVYSDITRINGLD